METKSKAFVFENETPWESVAEGIKKQIMGYDEKMKMVKVSFEVGAIGGAHTHTSTRIAYVAGGLFEFVIDGEKHMVTQGDGMRLEAGVSHSCTCIEKGLLIVCVDLPEK